MDDSAKLALSEFATDTIESLRASAESWINRVTVTDRPAFEASLRRLAELQVLIVTQPDRREGWQRDIAHVQNTLQSIAARYGLDAAAESRKFTAALIDRVLDIGFKALAVAVVAKADDAHPAGVPSAFPERTA